MMRYLLVLMLFSQLTMADEHSGYLQKAKQVGENVWIGPQPTEQDFNEFAAEEIGAVVNTRTEAEMKQVDFNEADQAAQYKITYDLLEIGTDHAYSPAKLEAFNALMTASEGKKMVLHCLSGNRASQLYAAWLIKYQNKSDQEALQAIQSDENELNDSIKTLLGR